MKTEEEYTTEEEFGGGGKKSDSNQKNKTNWVTIAFVAITLLTVLILISC